MTAADLPPGPAWLFCPGHRSDRFPKAFSAADSVILDLEDGVPREALPLARREVVAALADLDPTRTIVRINALDGDGRADLEALRETPLQTIMVPKAKDPTALDGLDGLGVIILCESARGVAALADLASHPTVVALTWGGEDLTADLAGRRARGADGRLLPHVRHLRTQTLLTAGAAGVAAIDGVWTDLDRLDGLHEETQEAIWMGYRAKLCIHPSHVSVIRRAVTPDTAEVDRALRLLAAAGEAGEGAIRFEGQMVDGPLLAQARAIVAAVEQRSD